MSRSPTKLVLAMAVLLSVWVGVFWLYKPRAGQAGMTGGISYGDPPDVAAAQLNLDPTRTRPDQQAIVVPLPPTPLPGSEPPVMPAPSGPRLVPPEFSDYTVQKGDTSFAAISRRVYGTGEHADAISKANPWVTPDKLFAGKTRLRIPKDPGNIQGRVENPEPVATGDGDERLHEVKAGETLGAISKRYYGTTTRWKGILEANSDLLDRPERLRPGMKLRIPKD